MINKKRVFIFGAFILCLFFLMTFAGGRNEEIETKTVEFIDGFNNETISLQEVEVGEDAEVPEDPEHENYVFVGWYLYEDQDVRVTDFTEILEDLTVIGKYADDKNNNGIADDVDDYYNVVFMDTVDNTIISTQTVLEGLDANAPLAPIHNGFTFAGWSRGYTNVRENITVNALYILNEEAAGNEVVLYEVTFIDGETDEVIEVQDVQEGLAATLPEPPVHENKVFDHWKGEYEEVTEDVTITAIYADDLNNDGINDENQEHYTVTYVDYDGTILEVFEDVLVDLETPTIENPTRENYEFVGWASEDSEELEIALTVTKDVTYTATYAPISDTNNDGIADEEQARIIFKDYDGEELYNNLVTIGENTPEVEEPTREYYEFAGWDKEVAEFVTEDATYTATYTPINDENNDGVADEEQARVIFKDYDGEELYNNLVTLGEITPEVEEPSRENYEFAGWDKEVAETVIEDATYTATYTPINDENNDGIADEEQAHYTIIYKDYDGKELETFENVLVNLETPTIANPTRENYEFAGWDKEVAEFVTENATYTATYTPINDENNDGIADEEQAHYTVTYKDYDGKELKTFENVLVNLETPTIANPTRTNYEFKGWDKEVAQFVTEDATYTATYAPINDTNNDGIADEEQRRVIFKDYDGEELYNNLVTLGEVTPEVEEPSREYYEFAGWTPALMETVTKDITYTATYAPINDTNNDGVADEEQARVIFKDYDGEELYNNLVTIGEVTPSIEEPTRTNYKFTGWDKEVAEIVTEDATYTATYAPINDTNNDGIADEEQRRIIFKDYDGKELYNGLITLGEKTPSVKEPTRENYEFAGWTPVLETTVTKDVTYTATYTAINDTNNDGVADEEQARVIFKDYDGQELYNNLVTLGETTPSVEEPSRTYYEFAGWTPSLEATVTKEITYTATYAPINDTNNDGVADEEQRRVIFKDYDGKELYNGLITLGETTPNVKEPTRENYEFAGWSPALMETVTKDVTYTATYTASNDTNNDGVADEEQVRVIFKDYDGGELYNNLVTLGEITPNVEEPTRTNYEFTGWTPELSEIVTKAITYTATYAPINDANNDGVADEEQRRVIFKDYDGKELYNSLITLGEATPSVKQPTRENYEFAGWTPTLETNVTKDVTYTATYTANNDTNNDGVADEEQARVIFKDYDGQELYNNLVTLGEITPSVEEPSRTYYEFTGWTPALETNVTKAITYTATYKANNDLNNDGIADEEQAHYTIIYVDYNETVIETFENVLVNLETPTIENPTREYYNFIGWTPELSETVTKEVTYKATYAPINDLNNNGNPDELDNTYVVNFYDFNHELVKTETVLEGLSADAPEMALVDGYTFTGWDKAFDNVNSNLEVYAVYVDDIKPVLEANMNLYNDAQNASINAVVTDANGIKTVKVLKGTHNADAFINAGEEMTLKDGVYTKNGLTENGYYTVYAEDNNGNVTTTTVLVEGIEVLEGDFEDLYATGTFGSLRGFPIFGTYKRNLSITTKENVKIADARVYVGNSYATVENFENDTNFGTAIEHTESKLTYDIEGRWLNRVTIYVNYEYQVEVAPDVFETRYISKLYKTRLTYWFGD